MNLSNPPGTQAALLNCFFLNDIPLPDSRMSDRLSQVVCRIQESPGRSFPAIFTEEKELDAFYRLMNNPRMSSEPVIEATRLATEQKVLNSPKEDLVLAIHDTTEFQFSSLAALEGMGRVAGEKKGFFGHFCLAVGMNREVMGLLGLKTWSRSQNKDKKKLTRVQRLSDPCNEGLRWKELAHSVHQRLAGAPNLVHVMDREADDYLCLSQFVEQRVRFVMRVQYDRNTLAPTQSHLFDLLKETRVICEREVPLQARSYKKGSIPAQKTRHPERIQRMARLGIGAQTITIKRADKIKKEGAPSSLTLNFVRVFELDAPADQKPVEWMLMTLEPIESEEGLLRIVDIYKNRWVIEEYFKALKTGCAFEKRGFESLEALINCLSILASMACQIYNLKMLSRTRPQEDARKHVPQRQIQILAQLTGQPEDEMTKVEDLVRAIARIGGHQKRNGPPGWQTLFRGYEKLLALEQGWLLAQAAFVAPGG